MTLPFNFDPTIVKPNVDVSKARLREEFDKIRGNFAYVEGVLDAVATGGFLISEGVPDDNVGDEGNVTLDVTNNTLYKKSNGVWGDPVYTFGTGGGVDEGAVNTLIGSYLTTNSYATETYVDNEVANVPAVAPTVRQLGDGTNDKPVEIEFDQGLIVVTQESGTKKVIQLSPGYQLYDPDGTIVGDDFVQAGWYVWGGTDWSLRRNRWADLDYATYPSHTLSVADFYNFEAMQFTGATQQTLVVPVGLVAGYNLGGTPPVYEQLQMEIRLKNTAGLLIQTDDPTNVGRIEIAGIDNPSPLPKTKVVTLPSGVDLAVFRLSITHDTDPLMRLDGLLA